MSLQGWSVNCMTFILEFDGSKWICSKENYASFCNETLKARLTSKRRTERAGLHGYIMRTDCCTCETQPERRRCTGRDYSVKSTHGSVCRSSLRVCETATSICQRPNDAFLMFSACVPLSVTISADGGFTGRKQRWTMLRPRIGAASIPSSHCDVVYIPESGK